MPRSYVREGRFCFVVTLALGLVACGSTGGHVRRGLVLTEQHHRESAIQPISVRQAIAFAVQDLERRGVQDIVICELSWMEADVSGAAIVATGRLSRSGGPVFDVFGLVVRDGTEAQTDAAAGAGAVIHFVARGVSTDQRVLWDPDPSVDDGEIAYKFTPPKAMEDAAAACHASGADQHG